MPLNLEIIDSGHIISIIITDPFTMKDLFDQYTTIQSHMDNAPFKVHTLVDLQGLKTVPHNALAGRNNPAITHRNSGYVAIIGGSVFAQRIIETAFKITGYDRVQFFKSVEAAHQFLQKVGNQN